MTSVRVRNAFAGTTTIRVSTDRVSRLFPWLHDSLKSDIEAACGRFDDEGPEIDMSDTVELSASAVNYLSKISEAQSAYPWHFYTFDSDQIGDFIGISRIADFLRCYGLMETLCPVDTDIALGILISSEISDYVKRVWIMTLKWYEHAAVAGGKCDHKAPWTALRCKGLHTARWAIAESKSHPDFPQSLMGYAPLSTFGMATRTNRLPVEKASAVARVLTALPGASDCISASCQPKHATNHSGGWVISGGFVRDLMAHAPGTPFAPKDVDFFLTTAYFGIGVLSQPPTAPAHRATAVLAFIRAQMADTSGWVVVQTKRVLTLRHQATPVSIQLVIPSSSESELREEPFRRFDIDACQGMLMRGGDLGGFPSSDLFVNGTTEFFQAARRKVITHASVDVSRERLDRHVAKGWRIDPLVETMCRARPQQADPLSPHDVAYAPGTSLPEFTDAVRQRGRASISSLDDMMDSVTSFLGTRTSRSAARHIDTMHPWLNLAHDGMGDDYYSWGHNRRSLI